MYFVCRRCGVGRHGADARLGVEGGRSRQAERLLCLAGASWSFAQASAHLRELSGLSVLPNTVRSVCQREAGRIETWQANDAAAVTKYRETPGNVEFETDGTCVNTTQGWKEMRVGVFAKRISGNPAKPENWKTRKLPARGHAWPSRRLKTVRRLQLVGRWWPVGSGFAPPARSTFWPTARSGSGSGSTFISPSRMALDVFHALEHVNAAAKIQFGEGSEATCRWQDQARDALLAEGWTGIERVIDATRPTAVRASQRAALGELAGYLRPHAGRLNYAQRLAEGRPIGSGMIEGACKNYLGRRMKQTGARWLIPNANRMAILGSLVYADQWSSYWDRPN